MKKIFSKISFPKAPGGNLYEWKKAETIFDVPQSGLFAIIIEASAKNAKQNRGKDDDDLRIALDGFDFGKYEHHQEMFSWKGFGTSASWDGASLKGGTKTIYFFARLEKGAHVLQFFADEAPILKSVEVIKITGNSFELKNLKPAEKIKNEHKGIPWLSFVFLGSNAKSLVFAVKTKNSTHKGNTDGDNLKVIVNGKILQNPYASKSYKYKNFYFSGDVKEFDLLTITDKNLSDPLAFENSVELWYDEEPEILNLDIEYFDYDGFLENIKEITDFKKYVFERAQRAIAYFEYKKRPYSADFLKHALQANPASLTFQYTHPLTRKIKADPMYVEILEKIKEKIAGGNLNGEIWPQEIDDGINFDSEDLKTAIHGILKIEYQVKRKAKNKFELELVLFDIYDFEKQNVPFLLPDLKKYFENETINALNLGEDLGVIHNFEIKIRLKDTLYADNTIHY